MFHGCFEEDGITARLGGWRRRKQGWPSMSAGRPAKVCDGTSWMRRRKPNVFIEIGPNKMWSPKRCTGAFTATPSIPCPVGRAYAVASRSRSLRV